MIGMQYTIQLPADYDMNIIYDRVRQNGYKTDGYAGLMFKAYLVTVKGLHGQISNSYCPLYVWEHHEGLNSFLFDGPYDAILQSFGWQKVQIGIPLQLPRSEDVKSEQQSTIATRQMALSSEPGHEYSVIHEEANDTTNMHAAIQRITTDINNIQSTIDAKTTDTINIRPTLHDTTTSATNMHPTLHDTTTGATNLHPTINGAISDTASIRHWILSRIQLQQARYVIEYVGSISPAASLQTVPEMIIQQLQAQNLEALCALNQGQLLIYNPDKWAYHQLYFVETLPENVPVCCNVYTILHWSFGADQ